MGEEMVVGYGRVRTVEPSVPIVRRRSTDEPPRAEVLWRISMRIGTALNRPDVDLEAEMRAIRRDIESGVYGTPPTGLGYADPGLKSAPALPSGSRTPA